jgi:hypothetical protein
MRYELVGVTVTRWTSVLEMHSLNFGLVVRCPDWIFRDFPQS